ncbi:MAG: hypothetical protein COB37_00535 [Kordiimonadales bacterium]|nr:MAG: hypothetical protein COB37_00535 [Kordiimonadales bacterium]
MELLSLFDSFFRFGGVISCLLASALVLRQAGDRLPAKLSAFCCFTAAAFMLATYPELGSAFGYWAVPIFVLSMFSPGAAWLFCLSTFEDDFKVRWGHFAVVGAFVTLCVTQATIYYYEFSHIPLISPLKIHAVLKDTGVFPLGISSVLLVIKFGFVGHMLWTAWQTKDDDLVEKRRKFRDTFLVVVVLVSVAVLFTENWLLGFSDELVAFVQMGQMAAVLGIVLYMIWHITGVEGDWLFGDSKLPVATEVTYGKTNRPLSAEHHDLSTLEKLAGKGTLLEAGLTINCLAGTAHMPEHRLRRLINQHLGFRNFADYLNFHRIQEAKSRLAIVDDRHVPVLTVAMDLGYGSLGPFNRAFKERAGMTPTEFRKKALADC